MSCAPHQNYDSAPFLDSSTRFTSLHVYPRRFCVTPTPPRTAPYPRSPPFAHTSTSAMLGRISVFASCYKASPVLYTFNTPTSCQQWVWVRDAHIDWSMLTCQGSTRSDYLVQSSLLVLYRGTLRSELRDPTNSWSDGVWRFNINKWTPPRHSGGIP